MWHCQYSLGDADFRQEALCRFGCCNLRAPYASTSKKVRLTIGAMLVWVFFENLGKGPYTPAGYANLINCHIKASHSPAAWKAVMGWRRALPGWLFLCRR